MSKAKTLASVVSDGAVLADGAVAVAEVSGAASLTGTETLSGKTITNLVFDGSITEEVVALGTSGSLALEPDNGTIQTCALTGNPTFTDALSAGQSLVLMLVFFLKQTVLKCLLLVRLACMSFCCLQHGT